MSAGRTMGICVGSGSGPTGSLMVALAPCADTTPTRAAALRAAAAATPRIGSLLTRMLPSCALIERRPVKRRPTCLSLPLADLKASRQRVHCVHSRFSIQGDCEQGALVGAAKVEAMGAGRHGNVPEEFAGLRIDHPQT